jgi:antitoxin PrlF
MHGLGPCIHEFFCLMKAVDTRVSAFGRPEHGSFFLCKYRDAVVLHFAECNGEGRMESAMTVKGQATIPKAIREHLGLKPGDRVKFFLHPDGSVALLPKRPIAALRGILKRRRRRPVTLEEMNEAIVDAAVEGVQRSRRR